MSSLSQAWKTGILTFFLSIIISSLSEFWTSRVVYWFSIVPLLLVIAIGILFDIIGTAVTAARETPYHAMAADKVWGAKRAIWLVRRADRVANFCNDVIGDICGTASGAINAALVINITARYYRGLDTYLASIVSLGFVAALTVGGKAWGKTTALHRANDIIYRVGQALATWDHFRGAGQGRTKKQDMERRKRASSRKRGI